MSIQSRATFDLHSRKINRITHKPSFVRGAVDPDLVRKSKTIAPGNLLLTLASIAAGSIAIGDRFYKFSAQYNDAIVTGILYALPVAVVLGLIAGYRIVSAWRRNERELLAYEASLKGRTASLNGPHAVPVAKPAPAAKVEAAHVEDDVRFLPARRNLPIAPRFQRAMISGMQTAA